MINKKTYLTFALSFIFINIAVFCIFYIPNFVVTDISDSVYEVWRLISTFATKLFDFTLPVVAATLLFLGYDRHGIKKTLLCALILALPRFFYILPYYYMQFWLYGYDSIEAVSLAALASLFGIAVFYGESVLLLYIIRKFPTRNLLAASVAEFCISLLFELWDFVGYLIEYAGNYRTYEIIELTSYLVFLAVELLIAYAVCCSIRKFLTNKSEDKENGINKALE